MDMIMRYNSPAENSDKGWEEFSLEMSGAYEDGIIKSIKHFYTAGRESATK